MTYVNHSPIIRAYGEDMNTLETIESISLFQGLEPEQTARLAEIAVPRSLKKGEELFHAGDPATGFYALLSGRVKVYRSSPAGKEQIIHVWGPGEVFGEVPVFQGKGFPASAQALEPSRALFFPRDGFKGMLIDDPELAMAMLALLSGRLRTLVNQVAELSLKEVPARLAAYLLLLRSSQDSDVLTLDLPKGQIASYLGTIQETLSRILKKMTEQHLIELEGKVVTLKDRASLERIAEGVDQL